MIHLFNNNTFCKEAIMLKRILSGIMLMLFVTSIQAAQETDLLIVYPTKGQMSAVTNQFKEYLHGKLGPIVTAEEIYRRQA